MKLRKLLAGLGFVGCLLTIAGHLVHNSRALKLANVVTTENVATSQFPTRAIASHPTSTLPAERSSSRETYFLYLVQTEQCLPPNLRSDEAIGNGSLGFDVTVLSYKEPCKDISLPHVQYLLNTTTTWTTGRNVLFESAMNRNRTYLYYIFLDDDVILLNAARGTTLVNPWRRFERFLRSVEPAIAAVDLLTTQHTVEKILKSRHEKGCALIASEVEYIACLWYDAIFNAFHYKAVGHILPYDPTFDKHTWWASQLGVVVKSEVLFRGQVVLHTEIYGENSKHRPYPRDAIQKQMYAYMTAGLEKRVPKELSSCVAAISEQWKTLGDNHGWTSNTLCLQPPSPRDAITPGRYACA